MRFFLRFILIGIIAYLCGTYLPQWPLWPAMVGALLVGLLFSRKRTKKRYGKQVGPAYAFWAGFFALLLVWGGVALMKDLANESLLSSKVAAILSANTPQVEGFLTKSAALVMVTGTLAGLAGGFSAMTGNLLGEAIKS